MQTVKTQGCYDDYYINRCDDEVPALKEFCAEKLACMNTKVVNNVNSVKIFSRMIAETTNSFTANLSVFSFCFICLILILNCKYGLDSLVKLFNSGRKDQSKNLIKEQTFKEGKTGAQ